MRTVINFNFMTLGARVRLCSTSSLSLSFAALLAGCPVNNPPPPPPPAEIAQCEGAGYTAFDVSNHAEQDTRVAGQTQIKALLESATPADAATKFPEAQAIYASAADLQAKVQGRTDDHLDGRPNVGADIDARIVAAYAAGAAATTALEIEIAAEIIDKSMTEFFFLSVFHEMVQGQAAKWDEAYGYYGAGPDNALDGVQAFARVAKNRDGNNGTAFEAAIFQKLVEGSCVLGGKLEELGVETVDVLNDTEMSAIIDDIDVSMRQVLAASVGHEAFEIDLVKAELVLTPGDVTLQNTARVKLVELDGFLRPIERLLRAEGAAATADALRNPLNVALADTTAGWIDTYDTAVVVTTLEAAFAIDIVE